MYKRRTNVKVGDVVGYRVAWLRSIGAEHSELSHERGTVIELRPLSRASEKAVAVVEWKGGGRQTVLADNLAKVGSLAFTSEDR